MKILALSSRMYAALLILFSKIFAMVDRLSTIRVAYRIVSIADGVITECGTHEQLLNADGVYANLYWTQNALALENMD